MSKIKESLYQILYNFYFLQYSFVLVVNKDCNCDQNCLINYIKMFENNM